MKAQIIHIIFRKIFKTQQFMFNQFHIENETTYMSQQQNTNETFMTDDEDEC